jgi:hypothetical protein
VGADGAYSAVRQIIYKDLAEKGKLPANDAKPLTFDQHCLGKKRGCICSFDLSKA